MHVMPHMGQEAAATRLEDLKPRMNSCGSCSYTSETNADQMRRGATVATAARGTAGVNACICFVC